MHTICTKTADEAWREATALLLHSDQALPQASRGGDTIELLHVGLSIQEPSQRWVVSRTPPLNPAFALIEVFWIVAGRQDAAFPTFWNPALPRFCGTGPTYHGAYGHRLRKHLGIDQLERTFRALESSPNSRQCVLQIWDSAVDLPAPGGTPVSADIPCNVVAMPKVRSERLEWMQVIRSNDVFRGLPHNIVQFTVIQEMLSGWLGIRPGSYCQLSDSLHAYTRDLASVRGSLDPVATPASNDSFALDRSTWDEVVPRVIRRLEMLTDRSLSHKAFRSSALAADTPEAYENSVLVAAADAARRRGWPDLTDECISRCTNPALVHLWSRWNNRCAVAVSGQAVHAAEQS